MIIDLLGAVSVTGIDVSGWMKSPSLVRDIADDVMSKAGPLLRFNDPKGIYSHCFCDLR